jgi:hypothetical protein
MKKPPLGGGDFEPHRGEARETTEASLSNLRRGRGSAVGLPFDITSPDLVKPVPLWSAGEW